MHISTAVRALSAVVTITLLTGCSSGLTIEQRSSATTSRAHFPGVVAPFGSPLGVYSGNLAIAHQPKSYYNCPATAQIEYLSDYQNNVINVFAGKFASQSPCGIITSVSNPEGLYVDGRTHDLYVANTGKRNILVFHRGQSAPYNTYADPSLPFPSDVTLAEDGTVIASNIVRPYGGSLSTWVGGPNGGTFVGSFPMKNAMWGGWVTVKDNGSVYYNDTDLNSEMGALWFRKCPHGACGIQTQVGLISFNVPGGLAIDNTNDLLANDARPGVAETFELPNPKPKTFPIAAGSLDLAIDKSNRHWFAVDSQNSDAAEYLYPNGTFVGTVQCAPGCIASGIAVDR